MTKQHQDIHYRHYRSGEDVIVYRQITIQNIKFKENSIEMTFTDYEIYPISPTSPLIKTIIIPILTGYSLIIN